jgi:hypothetical protein
MKGTKGRAKAHRGRTILLIGVIASLCFSAGEGLRLTPIPVSALAGTAVPDARLNAAASRGTSLHKYGPLDKPSQTQVQKRGKRQSLDCERPPSQNARKPSDDLLGSPGARTPVGFTSTPPVSEPADRAPPSLV